MNPAFDAALLSRIEDAGINASAPPQQRWLDGWLLRFSPGKAKRARCIQAVAAGRLGVAEKLALCLPVYEACALPLYVRVTPFSQPDGLDAQLAALGMRRQDDTRVMVCAAAPDSAPPVPRGFRLEQPGHHAFAEIVGGLRGSTPAERRAHAERLAQSPVPFQGYALVDAEGVAAVCGQIAVEAELVGLYDVCTAPTHRGQGLAQALCRQMLAFGRALGGRVAYLQVDADNLVARHIYTGFGFSDAYAYHYRTPDPGTAVTDAAS